jgi:hypothetical protein
MITRRKLWQVLSSLPLIAAVTNRAVWGGYRTEFYPT